MLSDILFFNLPKFWPFRDLVENIIATAIAYMLADFAFNRLQARSKKKLVFATLIFVATLLIEPIITVLAYFLPIP